MGLGNFFSTGRKKNAPQALNATTRAAASPPPEHTLRAFGEALNQLAQETIKMGEHVARMVNDCARIFLEHDASAAKQLIQADLEADRQKDGLLSRTIDVLALHQPVASDLRLVLASEHVASNLERAADHAKNIAKRALATPAVDFDPAVRDLLLRLHASVYRMLVDAVDAFKRGDTSLASKVLQSDQKTDALYDDLFHAVIARIQADSSRVAADVQALFVGKSLERIGDHATNIAEEARFRARGEAPSSTRRG